jgi:hypothetical protein
MKIKNWSKCRARAPPAIQALWLFVLFALKLNAFCTMRRCQCEDRRGPSRHRVKDPVHQGRSTARKRANRGSSTTWWTSGWLSKYVFYIGYGGPPDPLRTPLAGPGIDPPEGNEVPRPSRTVPGTTQNRRTPNTNIKTPPENTSTRCGQRKELNYTRKNHQ